MNIHKGVHVQLATSFSGFWQLGWTKVDTQEHADVLTTVLIREQQSL